MLQKIDQTEFGDNGNCQSVCLAMLLGLPLASVPNFTLSADTETGRIEAMMEWLASCGWGLVMIRRADSYARGMRGFYIVGGQSERGNDHATVWKDGQLWHDPHQDRSGVKPPYDIDVLYPLIPAMWSRVGT